MPGPYPLPTLAVIIDGAGAHGPTFADIVASLTASYQQIYGIDTSLKANDQDGQWIGVQAQAIYDTNQAVIAGYLSFSPATAQGVGLSNVVKINALQRLASSNSTVGITVAGDVGKIIVAGVVRDQLGYLWDLPPNTTIPLAGQVTVTATCETPGAISAGPNTVNIIQNVQPGWSSATNPASAAPGLPVETDATLRKRQSNSTALPGITPLDSLYGAIANLPGVGRINIHENDTNLYDVDLVPPHTIAVVVEGGDAMQIANTIFAKKNTGCGTYGTIRETVFDSQGVPCAINFFYLYAIPVFVTISIQPLAGYLESTGTALLNTVMDFIDTLSIGEGVYVGWLYAPANLAGDAAVNTTGLSQPQLDRLSATYVVRQIEIGLAADSLGAADIQIPFNAVASANLSNMILTLLPPTL